MPRERLSPLDASFLYLDGAVTCNQGLCYQVAEGAIDFERLVREMERKTRFVERLRQCAVFSPLNLFHPTWEFDPDFDIRNHVKRIVIDPPGDDARYWDTVSRIFRTHLDRKHPLWAIHVIDGCNDGRSAYLVSIHHCVTDGIGFARIASALFDAERDLEVDPWTPPKEGPWPAPGMRLLYGLIDSLGSLPRVVSLLARGTAALAGGLLTRNGRTALRLLRRYRRAPGVRFAFNAPLSGEASFSHVMLRLEDIARIRAATGSTINDVVLAIVATALHRYAESHGTATDGKFLRLLVPSNVRSVDTKDAMGNFVSMAPVLAPLGAMPVRERLAAITEYTRAMKDCGLARMLSLGIGLSQWALSPPVSYLAHRVFSSLWLQRRSHVPHKAPPFNLVLTNVPGSTNPSYAAGHELKDVNILVPLLASIGLVCCVLSHDGMMGISFSGDRATVPDVGVLPEYVQGAFNELMAGLPEV
ncbi:MAG: DUF1298 domain-containing protein [Candidatus Hydrogenedentes bacterium]|nr:DUF1298 domain-containing protein [Candidatus Hydrogenedentota bacterium]